MAEWLVLFDAPIVLGFIIVDGPDPNRPGHMMGVYPTLLGLLLRITLAIGGLWLAVRLKQSQQKTARIAAGLEQTR